MFGVVDYLWNGELLLIGSALMFDLLLGATITATIFGRWRIIFTVAKIYPDLGHRMGFLDKR